MKKVRTFAALFAHTRETEFINMFNFLTGTCSTKLFLCQI